MEKKLKTRKIEAETVEARRQKLADDLGQVAALSAKRLIAVLEDKNRDISPHQLAVINGVAMDKLKDLSASNIQSTLLIEHKHTVAHVDYLEIINKLPSKSVVTEIESGKRQYSNKE